MPLTMWHLGSMWAIRLGGIHYMTRATVLLFMLLLPACSDQTPPTHAVNEMIESPLQNTVISSADTYPPRPVTQEDLQRSDFIAANLEQHPVYSWRTKITGDPMITGGINPPFSSTP
jgi:hypothetical protein